jgi:selenocysteine lyase/cysteine desulfurase
MFSVRDPPAGQLKAQPAARTINVFTVALPPPGTGSVLNPEGPPLVAAVRASVHSFNAEDEVDRLVRAPR